MKLDKVGDGELAYYQVNPKSRGRPILILAGTVMTISTLNMALSLQYDYTGLVGLVRIGATVMGIVSLFTWILWRRVRARWQLWTRRFRHVVTLDRMGVETAVVFDAPWQHYLILDPMKTWMRDNLSGRYGILSSDGQTAAKIRAKHPGDQANFMQIRSFWFSDANDAFAFKLRWYRTSV